MTDGWSAYPPFGTVHVISLSSTECPLCMCVRLIFFSREHAVDLRISLSLSRFPFSLSTPCSKWSHSLGFFPLANEKRFFVGTTFCPVLPFLTRTDHQLQLCIIL